MEKERKQQENSLRVRESYGTINFNEYQQKIQMVLLKKLQEVKPPARAKISIDEMWVTILYKFVANIQKKEYQDIDPILLLPILINATKNGLLFERDYNVIGFNVKGIDGKTPVFRLTPKGAQRYLSLNFDVISLKTEVVWKNDEFVYDLGNNKIIKHIVDSKSKDKTLWENIAYAYCKMVFKKFGVLSELLVVMDKETLNSHKASSPAVRFNKNNNLTIYDTWPIYMAQAKVLGAMIKQVDGLVSTEGATISPLEMVDKIVDNNQEFKYIEEKDEVVVKDEKIDLVKLAKKAQEKKLNIPTLMENLKIDSTQPLDADTYKKLMEKIDE